jgi:alpha-1,2-mannosyltransferase
VSALVLLLCVRVGAALHNGISDCDETFNYWEPLHMILHGSGLQTWEYSPEFALRSYAFLLPYAAAARLGSFVTSLSAAGRVPEKLAQFYSVRVAQSVLCVVAEVSLYDSCVFRFGKPAARLFLLLLASSPGMFRASSELLPSSFAMIMIMFAFSHWFVGRFLTAVVFVALAAVLGWPFAALLAVPLALHVSYRRGALTLVSFSASCGVLLISLMVPIDSSFFGRVVVAPLNIVLYNVFPAPGAGPELYGVEPWTYYTTNLVLNCNVAFLLVLSYPVLCAFDLFCRPVCRDVRGVGQFRMTRLIFMSPCFLWMLVFFCQPHKEERFLAPIYPLLALVAAVAVSDWCLLLFGDPLAARAADKDRFARQSAGTCASPLLRNGLVGVVALLAVAAGASRVAMQVRSFGAPFRAFENLNTLELRNGLGPRSAPAEFSLASSNINVCVGGEWHRFPSHFFLPGQRVRLRFVRSSFSGLLPKPFDEAGYGTRTSPPGMNMYNKEDPNQYVDDPASDCHYFVDLDLSGGSTAAARPQTADEAGEGSPFSTAHRLTLFSEQFVDLERSPVGYRSFWIPGETERRVTSGMFEVHRNLRLLPITH